MTTATSIISVSSTVVTLNPILSTAWAQPESCELTYSAGPTDMSALAVTYPPPFEDMPRTCWPEDVTKWWLQTSPVATYTAFGPTFMCPEAYTAYHSTSVAEGITHVCFCPSGYIIPGHMDLASLPPPQCVSSATPGQVLSFINRDPYVADETVILHGQIISGYNVDANLGDDKGEEKGLTLATTIGLSVGIVAGMALFAAGAWILRRRWRRARASRVVKGGAGSDERRHLADGEVYEGAQASDEGKPEGTPVLAQGVELAEDALSPMYELPGEGEIVSCQAELPGEGEIVSGQAELPGEGGRADAGKPPAGGTISG